MSATSAITIVRSAVNSAALIVIARDGLYGGIKGNFGRSIIFDPLRPAPAYEGARLLLKRARRR
jgi:hypothetical protein